MNQELLAEIISIKEYLHNVEMKLLLSMVEPDVSREDEPSEDREDVSREVEPSATHIVFEPQTKNHKFWKKRKAWFKRQLEYGYITSINQAERLINSTGANLSYNAIKKQAHNLGFGVKGGMFYRYEPTTAFMSIISGTL